MKKINAKMLSAKQKLALQEIASDLGFELDEDGSLVEIIQVSGGIQITRKPNGWEIKIKREAYFLRAISLIIENFAKEIGFTYKEVPRYQELSGFIDVSRNAVMTIEAFQKAMRILACMGYTSVQLYMEDVYELEEYPYFGYMRGRYSKVELKAMDSYAEKLNIELIPCIQTLAHVGGIFRWKEFTEVHDCNDILLVGEEKTYQLIEAMFSTLSQCFTSKKVNISMDEAFMLGLGKYLDKHGYTDRFTIMSYHIKRVVEIAKVYGYQPMMWSDMFFRLANEGEYYVKNTNISQELIAALPEEISLIYWDYFTESTEGYAAMLESHLQFKRPVIFATNAWKCHGFTPGNLYSIYVGKLAAEACKLNGIEQVLVTTWGDNGAEASFFSILPTLAFWAETCYSEKFDETVLASRFKLWTKGDYADFLKLDLPSLTPDNPAPGQFGVTPPKYLFYQDVLCGLFEKHILAEKYTAHFSKTAENLSACLDRNPHWQELFAVQISLCKVLILKTEAGLKIKEAYELDDKASLQKYMSEILPEILNKNQDFQKEFKKQWLKENKIFGLDAFDLRIGGLKERINSAIERLDEYLSGKLSNIPELEVERLPMSVSRFNGAHHFSFNKWLDIATVSNMVEL